MPGLLDPQIGINRTDAPTWVAVQVAVTLAVSVVSGALPGMPPDMSMHVCASSDGLSAVGKFPPQCARDNELQDLKGACGSTEAPHLWYLKTHSHRTGPVTLTELRCTRAVCTTHDSAGTLRVIVTSCVDDRLPLGKRSDQMYQKIKKLIFEQLDKKSWQDPDDPKGVDDLGLDVEARS